MTAAWPGGVNQIVNQDSYGEAPERNVAAFTPEVGPPKERLRMSISTNIFSLTGWFSSAEYDLLVTFYRTTLSDGTQPFTRNHPRTGVSATFKFTDVPKITQVIGLTYVVAMSLRLMP